MSDRTEENAAFVDSGEETPKPTDEWVHLDLKLIDWSFMDKTRIMKLDTTVHTVKETLREFHGGNVSKLTLCAGAYQESNELRDDKRTLKDMGITGSSNKNEAPIVVMFYNFIPDGREEPDPILMC